MTIQSNDYEPKFSGFHDLMKFRVREILLVSSLYDAFVLEEDAPLSERLLGEFIDLNLQFIPRITRVQSADEGLKALDARPFDLVITMTRLSDMNPVDFGTRVKERDPGKTVVMLSIERLAPEEVSLIRRRRGIDKIFFWTGDAKILLAAVKWAEDRKNAARDSEQGVQAVLIVEDSPRFYSSFLPIVYAEIMTQTRSLISEGVNHLHRLLRMRARPKILAAESYEEAMEVLDRYRLNLLGLISDVRFPRAGKPDDGAGFALAAAAKDLVRDLPVLLQSSDESNRRAANECGASFLHKDSPNVLAGLREFMAENLGFGDFVFRTPDGSELCRARDLAEFESMMGIVPAESIAYHAAGNHISRWLRARTEFQLADELRPKRVSDFGGTEEIRRYIRDAVRRHMDRSRSGVVLDFGIDRLARHAPFVRIGTGSLGGKGRGLFFMNSLLSQTGLASRFPDADIRTPETFIILSDVFEEFVSRVGILDFAFGCRSDDEIARRIQGSEPPSWLEKDLGTLIEKIRYPLAVRSSSILEDSQMLPFAGLYRTYLLPNNHPDAGVRLARLIEAVKMVWASVFFLSPREFARNTSVRIEEEKMAVIVQQLVGEEHGGVFYPTISGVAQSYNFYPFPGIGREDGIAQLALGLGKTIVEGGRVFRVSPAHPRRNPPFSSAAEFLEDSQTSFYALDMSPSALPLTADDSANLRKFDLGKAEEDGTLFFIGSTYSAADDAIRDTMSFEGPRALTFAHVLKHDLFPLAGILSEILDAGKKAFGTHVEIEFAANLGRKDSRPNEFDLLQIRPMVVGAESVEVRVSGTRPGDAVCLSSNARGNGVVRDLKDIVFLDPQSFELSRTRQMAAQVDAVNRALVAEGRPYVLIGMGRWGTSDPWLGVPVEWGNISGARIIVECNAGSLRVEPSQGSHFFHNLVSLRIGYLHVRTEDGENTVAWDWLRSLPVHRETEFVKHARLDIPMVALLDGRTSRGAVLKPGVEP